MNQLVIIGEKDNKANNETTTNSIQNSSKLKPIFFLKNNP